MLNYICPEFIPQKILSQRLILGEKNITQGIFNRHTNGKFIKQLPAERDFIAI